VDAHTHVPNEIVVFTLLAVPHWGVQAVSATEAAAEVPP
jgi:hypothetical protein